MDNTKLNLVVIVIITLVLGIALGWFFSGKMYSHSSDHGNGNMSVAENDKKLALYTGMRELWADHMQYTYSTVDAYFNDQGQLQPNLDRLLQNQKDIGNAIRPLYGDAAANKLTDLLTTHINDAVPVLAAAKAGDTDALNKAVANWQSNAKDIADFLASTNPTSWPASATEPMMKEHINTTITYATDLAKGDYAQSIKDYQKAYDHMMMMSDVLSQGIIAQNPDKF